jgi:helicase required for RNAi-mediated heterochromatin assembly 1
VQAHITAITFSNRGIGLRFNFSLSKVGRNIRWEQSKRLLTGTLVALTPSDDMFRTKCIVAVVAARPLDGLMQNPPQVDLFFARGADLCIDSSIEFTMVEERASFFEASRHTMMALQHMMREQFPLKEHLIDVENSVQPPQYLQRQPFLNMRSIFKHDSISSYENVDVLNDWPEEPSTSLEQTQLHALKRILTKRLAIIQGPPGTGKTHVSIMAIKVMLDNMKPGDPPILVACQTNHAIDQLLRHVASFEENFARLGGRSKDQDVIKPRTLYFLRKGTRNMVPGGLRGPARTRLDALSSEMCKTLSCLELGKGLPDHVLLRNMELLTPAQCKSLEQGDDQWSSRVTATDEVPLKKWLGKQLLENKRCFQRDDFGYDYEEIDLEFEQLKVFLKFMGSLVNILTRLNRRLRPKIARTTMTKTSNLFVARLCLCGIAMWASRLHPPTMIPFETGSRTSLTSMTSSRGLEVKFTTS